MPDFLLNDSIRRNYDQSNKHFLPGASGHIRYYQVNTLIRLACPVQFRKIGRIYAIPPLPDADIRRLSLVGWPGLINLGREHDIGRVLLAYGIRSRNIYIKERI